MNNNNGQPWNGVPRTMTRGQTYSFYMRLQNAGTMRWARFSGLESNIVAMSYHWLYSDGTCCAVWDGLRSYLPATPSFYNNLAPNYVPPGMRVYMSVNVQAPSSPGSYIVEFDMVQEGVTWFNQQGGWLTVRVPVTVQ